MLKEQSGVTFNLLHRVITLLNRQEMDTLDKIGKDALFSTGHKLSYAEILRGLIEFAIEIELSGENVDSIEKLKQKIYEKTRKKMEEKKNGGAA